MDSLLMQRWAYAAAAIAAGVLLGVAATLGWRWYRLRRERLRRQRRIEAVSIERLHEIAIPDGGGGLLHVDYLLLTARGLLILDVRDVVGNVFGSDPMVDWTVMQGARRHTFGEPARPDLDDRIAALKSLADDLPVEGRIVFGPGAVFPKGLPRLTLREESLEAEFPLGDRTRAEQLVEGRRPVWDRLRTQLHAQRIQRKGISGSPSGCAGSTSPKK
jgi:hypothetical protein